MSRPKYIPALDGIRGIAVLAVVLFHYSYPFYSNSSTTNFFQIYLNDLLSFGGCGVFLFFVLSGFLITRILLQAQIAPGYFKNFFIRRTFRIFPIYYATLALFFLFLPLLNFRILPEITFANQHFLWFYLTNLTSVPFGDLSHLWSLAVEEQFYLIWPFVVYFFSPKTVFRIILGYFTVFFISRLVFSSYLTHKIWYSLSCFQYIFFGCLLALGQDKKSFFKYVNPKNLLLAFIVFVVSNGANRALETVLTNLLNTLISGSFFAFLIAVCSVEKNAISNFFKSGWLQWLGKYSYAIYIFHLPVQRIGSLIFDRFNPLIAGLIPDGSLLEQVVWTSLCFTLSLTAAYISWHLLEKHCIGFARKITSL